MPATRRRGAHDTKAPAGRRFNAHLREESIQRLVLHALMARRNPGDLLSDLIDEHLRRWRIQENAKSRAMLEVSAEIDGDVESPVPDSLPEAA